MIPFTALMYIVNGLLLLVYKPKRLRVFDKCIEIVAGNIWGSPRAQCLGTRVIWYDSTESLNRATTRVHERIHTYHGELINTLSHAILVPLGWYLGPWWLLSAILVSQLAFILTYVIHFSYRYAIRGFPRNIYGAYRGIWTENKAHAIEFQYGAGKHPGAWGE